MAISSELWVRGSGLFVRSFVFGILIIFLLVPNSPFLTSVQAHLVGQPPFFKINGVYTNLYPVPLTSLENFSLPQDLAAENYLVNQPLAMELDLDKLPAPPEVIAKTKFTWNFGDLPAGRQMVQASGFKNTHTYLKPGSYIMSVYADDGSTPNPQVIQSTMINILPDKSYQLPKSVIKVNNQKSKDPLTDILHFKFGGDLNFDASEAVAPSSKIVSYLWDFGDRSSSDQARASHSYPADLSQVFPVLRVKDANGFIVDSFVEVENNLYSSDKFQNSNVNPSTLSADLTAVRQDRQAGAQGLKRFGPLVSGLIFVILAGVTAFMVRRYVRGRYRGKR